MLPVQLHPCYILFDVKQKTMHASHLFFSSRPYFELRDLCTVSDSVV